MVPLCNQEIMNKLTLSKMHFIICLSTTINNIPEKVESHVYSVDNNSLKEPSRITASKVKGNYKGGGKVHLFWNVFQAEFSTFNCICINML